ncbi:arsenate reductase family protein [Halarcobacter mediterraneus]|uniref:Arsenate reductase family protein n=1 Tax=Halarcobacter mediterraneus TaxID=2023153 RepID=A0A4Q1AUC1_9BACT|nr:arsenate reductase family protein [Halarcobacter mediterraneus]RXK13502.1 arsenate reductase family protein [Halarcobacter mediterraneus]
MIKVYGIKTCNSVRSALKFFKDNNIEVDFFDFKKDTPEAESIDLWVEKAGIDIAFNSRGTKYRTLKLKELNLDEAGKIEWLKKEPMLLKRPVIEYDKNKVLIGFNENLYKETFL